MATLTLSAISAVLNLIYGEPMADQIRRDVLLLNLLPVVPDRNDTCYWRAKFTGRSTAGPKAEGHAVTDDDFSSHTRKQLTLAWGEYYAYARVSGLAKAIHALDGGGSLLDEEIIDAIDELAVDLSQDTYGGDVTADPVEIEGLARAVTATGVYAGLDQATEAEWAAAVNTLAATDLSVKYLREKLIRPFKDATGVYPEFVVCPGDLWDAVGELFGSERRYVDQVTTVRGTIEMKKLAGGFRAIEVDSIPFIEDRHCTADTFYVLHSRQLSYRQVPAFVDNLETGVLQNAVKDLVGVTLDEGVIERMLASGEGRLTPTIEALAKTGDRFDVMIKCYLQLRLKSRKFAAKLTLT